MVHEKASGRSLLVRDPCVPLSLSRQPEVPARCVSILLPVRRPFSLPRSSTPSPPFSSVHNVLYTPVTSLSWECSWIYHTYVNPPCTRITLPCLLLICLRSCGYGSCQKNVEGGRESVSAPTVTKLTFTTHSCVSLQVWGSQVSILFREQAVGAQSHGLPERCGISRFLAFSGELRPVSRRRTGPLHREASIRLLTEA